MGPCLCGATDCPSCGPAQGYGPCDEHGVMACEPCALGAEEHGVVDCGTYAEPSEAEELLRELVGQIRKSRSLLDEEGHLFHRNSVYMRADAFVKGLEEEEGS